MAGFTAPAGDAYNTPTTIFERTPLFRGGIATVSPGITTPTIPATTVAVANTTTVDVMVYVTSGGGAVTAITVGGTATGLNLGTATTSSASVYLPAGTTIALTYASTAPTWTWAAV